MAIAQVNRPIFTTTRFVPAHEVAFQVLDGNTVKTNIFYRSPLLQTFEGIMQMFEARLEEDEIQVGLFRVPVPNYHKP